MEYSEYTDQQIADSAKDLMRRLNIAMEQLRLRDIEVKIRPHAWKNDEATHWYVDIKKTIKL